MTATSFSELISSGVLEIGDGYRAKVEELGGAGPIFLRAGHVTDSHIDFDGVERFHEAIAFRLSTKMSRAGDTVVTTKGNSTGRTSFVRPEMPMFVYSPHLSYWRSLDKSRLDPRFLRYWSQGDEFTRQLAGMKGSTDMAPYLSLTDQRRLRITLPTIRDQRAVGAVLGSLDEKIELNRRMNRTLEEMARALFKSWFVDFDPVHAKSAGRPPSALDPATAALFPNSFEDSPLGKIPKGWTVQALREVTSKIGSGATPHGGSAVYVSDGVALIRSQNVHDHEFRWDGLARIGQTAARELEGVTVQEQDVLLNITGDSILRTCVVDPAVLPARVNQHVMIIRASAPVTGSYLHQYLVRREMKDHLRGFDAGATRPAITKAQLACLQIVVPAPGVLHLFDAYTNAIFARVDLNRRQSRDLAALRDTLLSRLISGELSVKAAEEEVSA